jgi:hypothetical protein
MNKSQLLSLKSIKEISKAKGFIYKAPNGKKSNLNKFNWLLARTKQFRKFFGNWVNIDTNELLKESSSLIVDDNREPLITTEIKKEGLFSHHYTSHNDLSNDKYFLNMRTFLILKNCDWHYNLFNQVIVRMFNLGLHDLLNLLQRYELNKEEIKKDILWLFDDEQPYSSGEELFVFLKNKVLYQRVMEGTTSQKNFLKLFAKYIGGEKSLKGEVLNGFKEILLMDGIRYYDTYTGKNFYIVFSKKDLYRVSEDPRHINNFDNWFILNEDRSLLNN